MIQASCPFSLAADAASVILNNKNGQALLSSAVGLAPGALANSRSIANSIPYISADKTVEMVATLGFNGTTFVAPAAAVSGNVSAGTLGVTGNATVGGTLAITGTTTLAGASFSGTITGPVRFGGNVAIGDAVDTNYVLYTYGKPWSLVDNNVSGTLPSLSVLNISSYNGGSAVYLGKFTQYGNGASGSPAFAALYGLVNSSSGAFSASFYAGVKGEINYAASIAGTLTEGNGGYFLATNSGGGTVNTMRGVLVGSGVNSGGGTVGVNVGLEVGDQTVGSTNRAIKTGLGPVQFGDAVIYPVRADAGTPNGSVWWSSDNPGVLKARQPDGTLKVFTLA
jgi:hypothetical protein